MKAFISYSHKDGNMVTGIAQALGSVLGKENVFFDAWSIQPGDGIIDRMNMGLSDCDFFFFFVSKASLTSEMAKMEWQNALMAEAKRETKFIPVKLDDCTLPSVMLQKLYIDIYHNGIEAGIRQVVDVVRGQNTFHSSNAEFHNLKAYATVAEHDYHVDIVIRAESFMEPISRYVVALKNANAHLSCVNDSMVTLGKAGPVPDSKGQENYIYSAGVNRATTPGFPFRLSITDNTTIEVSGVMHAIGEDEYERVPIIAVLPDAIFHLGRDVMVPIDDVIGTGKSQSEIAEYMTRIVTEAQGSPS